MKTFKCPLCQEHSVVSLHNEDHTMFLNYCYICDNIITNHKARTTISKKFLEKNILTKQKKALSSLNKTWFRIKDQIGLATVKKNNPVLFKKFNSGFVEINITKESKDFNSDLVIIITNYYKQIKYQIPNVNSNFFKITSNIIFLINTNSKFDHYQLEEYLSQLNISFDKSDDFVKELE